MARTNRIAGRWPLISLLTLGFAMPAMAQAPAAPAGPQSAPQTAPQAAQDRDTRDVVVVTANKREESVQDIAVAVTAISSAVRDQIGLATVQDYTNFAPGLSYSTASDRLGMRGVTRTSNNFGIRSGISNYVDGIYYSTAILGSNKESIFVDRIEVVRGPQGTLYGRDSIGGALNSLTKRPNDTFTAQFNMGIDNWDGRKVEARVSGPITDWLRYEVGGSRSVVNKGFFTNYSGGESEGGRTDGYYLEGQLAGNIGDSFDWWVRAARTEWNKIGAPGARTGVGGLIPYDTRYYDSTADIGPNAFFGLTTPTRIQTGTQITNPAFNKDRRGFNTDFTNFAKLRPTDEYVAEAVYHAPAFDIKYLGGYVYYNYDLQQDHDGSPISQYTLPRSGETIYTQRQSDYQENRGWFSNEINLISTGDGPLQWTTGLYAYQENYSQTVFVGNMTNPGGPIYDSTALQGWLATGGPALGTPRPTALPELQSANGRNSASGAPWAGASLIFFTDNVAVNNSYGAFFQTDYKITEQFKVTAGLRYSGDYSRGREYARIVNHYTVEDALETGLIPLYAAPVPVGLGLPLATASALVTGATPPRIDVTRTLGGADPTTITTANPCGFAGKGVLNTNVTTANSATNASGGCAVTDKSRFGIYYDSLTGNGYRDMAASWHAINGILGLDWTPDTDTLVYAKYNRGYKPGGFGAADVFGILSPTPYTDKESVDAIEVGLKREWRDWNLTTDIVAYYNDYKGYQTTNLIIPPTITSSTGVVVQPNSYTAYLNLPKTEITGIELETIWRPMDDLRILFNYGFNNPEIKNAPALIHALDPYALDPAAKRSGPVATTGEQTQDITGNVLPFSPKNKIAVNAVYTTNFEDGSKIDWSASYFWQDIAFSSIFNRSYTKIPAWDQEDVRLSWTSSDRRFTVIGFGKNIFDNTVYDNRGAGLVRAAAGAGRVTAPTQCASSAATTSPAGGKNAQSCYAISETLRPPRTYGIEVQFRY